MSIPPRSRTKVIPLSNPDGTGRESFFGQDFIADQLASIGFWKKTMQGPTEPAGADRAFGTVWIDNSAGTYPAAYKYYSPATDTFVPLNPLFDYILSIKATADGALSSAALATALAAYLTEAASDARYATAAQGAKADAAIPAAEKAAANGVATLDGTSKVPVAQLPDIDAAKTTTGTFDPARIPASVRAAPIVASGDLTTLTAPQLAAIGEGSGVITSDGVTYYYSGTGDKTLAASYVVGADKTPDWTQVANRPPLLSGVTGVIDPATSVARAIVDGDLPAEVPLTDEANTFTARQNIAITSGAADTAISNRTVGTSGAPRGALTSSYGYSADAVVAYIEPRAPTGVEPNADGLFTATYGKMNFVNGTRGIATGGFFEASLDGTWTPGAGTEPGAVAVFSSATTSRGGSIFGGGFHAGSTVTAGARLRGIEADCFADGVTVESLYAGLFVSPASDTGVITGTITVNGTSETIADTAGIALAAIGAGRGFKHGLLMVKSVGGAQPVPTDGTLFYAGGYTAARGIDFHTMDFSGPAMLLRNGHAISATLSDDTTIHTLAKMNHAGAVGVVAPIAEYANGNLKIHTGASGGGSWSGSLTVERKFASSAPLSVLNCTPAVDPNLVRNIQWETSGVARYNWDVSGAETGSNAGSSIGLYAYSDAGSLIDTLLTYDRATTTMKFPASGAKTTASAANAFIGADGFLQRSTSALKYKRDVVPLGADRAKEIVKDVASAAITYRSATATDDPSRQHIGVAADWMTDHPELIHYGSDGQVEGFAYERVVAAQSVVIAALEARLAALEARGI